MKTKRQKARERKYKKTSTPRLKFSKDIMESAIFGKCDAVTLRNGKVVFIEVSPDFIRE